MADVWQFFYIFEKEENVIILKKKPTELFSKKDIGKGRKEKEVKNQGPSESICATVMTYKKLHEWKL